MKPLYEIRPKDGLENEDRKPTKFARILDEFPILVTLLVLGVYYTVTYSSVVLIQVGYFIRIQCERVGWLKAIAITLFWIVYFPLAVCLLILAFLFLSLYYRWKDRKEYSGVVGV
jgi:hypothetical protein